MTISFNKQLKQRALSRSLPTKDILFTPLNGYDLTPLSGLTNLTDLYLHENRIVNLKPLSGLTNLTELYLPVNKIVNLKPLSGLTNLTGLGLGENKIVNLKPLSGLTNLTYLDLSRNHIVDLKPLSGLTNLKELNLRDNPIVNLSPLSALTNLEELSLSGNRLPNLSCLLKLSDLNIYWNNVRLPRKYWIPVEQWSAQWILDETNAELRWILIQQIGYQKILEDLAAIQLDSWREYSLLKIEISFRDEEDVYLLKMICPSTGHLHIHRVPPVNSAIEAIRWVNWGIDPEDFGIET